jgi:hypothetical protein
MGSRNLWKHHKHPLIRNCKGEKPWENIKNSLFHKNIQNLSYILYKHPHLLL